MSLVKVSEKTKVPQGAGVEGFLRTLKKILQLRRLQSVHISSNGTVEYEHYVVEEDNAKPSVDIDFNDASPAYVIQHVAPMQEVSYTFGSNASEVICRMFNEVTKDDLVPFAFVTGTNSKLRDWHAKTSMTLSGSTLYGLPLFEEQSLPDDILVLCAAYERNSSFVDTLRTYKIALIM